MQRGKTTSSRSFFSTITGAEKIGTPMNQSIDRTTLHSLQADGQENTFAEYIGICWRRRWLILALTFGFAAAAAIWSYTQAPIYEAKATVVIEQEGAHSFDKDKSYPLDTSPEYFQTHFELMKSRKVLQGAARLLHLSEQPEYRPQSSGTTSWKDRFLPLAMNRWWGPKDTAGVSADEEEDLLLKQFSQHIEVMPVRGARLAHITVSSKDAQFAALAANTLASVYIDRTQELSAHSKEKAAQWFTDHLKELRDKVEASEQALYMFRSQHGLLEGAERQTVAAHSLTELNSELVKAEMKKADAKTRYEQIQSILHGRSESGAIDWSNLNASTEVLSSPLIQILRGQEIKASGQIAELSDKYGPLHPKMARAKAEVQDLREQIQREVQKIYDSVKREYDVALARESAIKEAVGRYRKDKIKVGQYEIEHGIMEREAQSSRHLYDIFLKVTKEADVASGMRAGNVYLADPAVSSSVPVKPKKKLNTMLGLLVGFMSGLAAALILEARDRSLKGPGDVERYLPSISLLGVVPLLPKTKALNGLSLLSTHPGAGAESFRTIRTSLLLSNPDQLPSSVLVTSPGESEGKTTLAVNLAMALAQLDDTRVVLIDGDLRAPHPHPIFDIETGNGRPKGLVDYLTARAGVYDIVHQTIVANLSVIPRGLCPPNPSELLHSKHMSRLLNGFREKGYHVILDAPPVLPVADPAVLAPQVDGVLLVVSAGTTTREACRSAILRLTSSGGKLLGVVLQKARLADVPYYASHYKNGVAD